MPSGIARTGVAGTSDSYSVAAIVLFDDRDRDGVKDRGEQLVGGSASHVILHTGTGVSLIAGAERLAPGFHLMAIDRPSMTGMVPCVEDEDRQLALLHPADAATEDVDLVIEPGEDEIIPETECEEEDED